MKAGWEAKPLGELCDILDSMRKPVTKKDRVAGEIPYYGATGIQDYVADYLFDEPLVLVGEDGAKWEAGENTAFAVSGKCWVNNHAHVLRPHRKTIVDNWLIYYLNATDLTEYVSGLTVPKLNQGNLRQIPIPVPTLPEQRRIVAILDEAFEGIAAAKANADKNLGNGREVFEGWREALFQSDCQSRPGQHLLGDLVNVQNGFAFKSGEYCDTGHFVVRIGNVQDGELVLDNPRFIKLTDAKQRKFVLNVGDILVSLTGNIGRAAIVEAHHLPAVLNQRVARITTKTDAASNEWVFAFLTSQSFRQRLQTAGHGAAQQNVSTKEIEAVPVCLPSKKEQELQIAQVKAMRSSVANWNDSYTRRLAALDELKASLLHQAFTGQL